MKIIAIKERSAGNAEVGDMWLDTAIFEPAATLMDVLIWAQNASDGQSRVRRHAGGRLMLSIAEEPKREAEDNG